MRTIVKTMVRMNHRTRFEDFTERQSPRNTRDTTKALLESIDPCHHIIVLMSFNKLATCLRMAHRALASYDPKFTHDP